MIYGNLISYKHKCTSLVWEIDQNAKIEQNVDENKK